jgi:hypothetical protein
MSRSWERGSGMEGQRKGSKVGLNGGKAEMNRNRLMGENVKAKAKPRVLVRSLQSPGFAPSIIDPVSVSHPLKGKGRREKKSTDGLGQGEGKDVGYDARALS